MKARELDKAVSGGILADDMGTLSAAVFGVPRASVLCLQFDCRPQQAVFLFCILSWSVVSV